MAGEPALREPTISRLTLLGDTAITVPEGIEHDVTMTELPCEDRWAIFYDSAREALDGRLSREQISRAQLPRRTIEHLHAHETAEVVFNVRDVLRAYNL